MVAQTLANKVDVQSAESVQNPSKLRFQWSIAVPENFEVPMRRKTFPIAVIGILAAVFAGSAVSGTSPATAQEVLRSAPEIAQCLCLEQDIARLYGEYARVRDQFNASADEARSVAAELERTRGAVNVADERSVDAFRQKVIQLQSIEARRDQLIPSVQEAAGQHNAKVGEFQRRCGGRYYDGALLPQVRATLSCPSQ
ncbi:MAG TPA: hypothetical protein VLG66_16290 [Alphaproteobacteria bacterium]|nr:hypothetical protein [Alphaproteobacteria bacterium]